MDKTELINLLQKYLGMQPKDVGCNTWGEMQIKMAGEITGLLEIAPDRIILAEQHRNTRHDACDAITEIRSKWREKYDFKNSEPMLNEITGAIMNLKQRKPNY